MEELSLLDSEEKLLLICSCLSLVFTCSFIYSYLLVFRHKINYIDIPFLIITFGYLNNLVYYYYSELIYHDYMQTVYNINHKIYLFFIIIYLIYEFKDDKIDTFLNFLIVLTVSWAIKKLLIDIFNDEDKVKYVSVFSTISLYVVILELIIRAFKEKKKNILNILTPFCLVVTSVCHVIYGLIYEELSFFIPNIIGIVIGCIYIGVWLYLRRKYGEYITKKEDLEGYRNENNEVKKENEKLNEIADKINNHKN